MRQRAERKGNSGEVAADSVTGIVLAGGRSRRLGQDKALLPWPEANSATTLLAHVHALLATVFAEVLVVGNREDLAEFRVVPDVAPVQSSLTGLVSGLQAAQTPLVLAVACDMPFLDVRLLRALIASATAEWDVAAPLVRCEPETLHTVYRRRCLPVAQAMLQAGDYRLGRLLGKLRVRTMPVEEVRRFDPALASLENINTPHELATARARARRLTRDAATGGFGEV